MHLNRLPAAPRYLRGAAVLTVVALLAGCAGTGLLPSLPSAAQDDARPGEERGPDTAVHLHPVDRDAPAGPDATGAPASPDAASSAGSAAAEMDAAGSQQAAAVWCPGIAPSFSGAVPDEPLVAGPISVSASVPDAAGRTVAWSVIDTAGATWSSGTSELDVAGAFATVVSAPAGTSTFVSALTVTGVRGTTHCPSTRTVFTVLPAPAWISGASGAGVADGTFGAWRGTPTRMAGTWADDNDAMVGLWQLRTGGEFAQWSGDLDIAVGAIGPGESWSAAAAGAYDARWRQSLRELSRLWEGRPGQLYVRFAHEFNGDWYPWSVTAASATDFRTAWQRYRAMQQEILPAAKLVLAPTGETAASTGLDWRQAFPGKQYVDVMAVDYYNMYPWAGSVADFRATSLAYDVFGAPRGLQRHQEFARAVGLPFAVSEWGNNADFGDSAVFIEQMHAFLTTHAGSHPGGVLYDVYFNVDKDDTAWALHPRTRAPGTAAAYQRLF